MINEPPIIGKTYWIVSTFWMGISKRKHPLVAVVWDGIRQNRADGQAVYDMETDIHHVNPDGSNADTLVM